MSKEKIINQTIEFVKEDMVSGDFAHDWWHIYRVWNNAKHIGQNEKVDIFVVELAALLHDIADWKFNSGDIGIGLAKAKNWLEKLGVDEQITTHVCQIIKESSFKGSQNNSKMKTVEGMVVQDADRLDAIGAIGIARAFTTGARFNELLHDPRVSVPSYKDEDEYIKAKGEKGRTVINHFYEKLFLLKDLMNTETGKSIAQKRHKYMEDYLEEFYKEWDGEC